MNFTLATFGRKVHIYPAATLYHHGEKRGYAYNSGDYLRNRIIATYLFGGQKMAETYLEAARGHKSTKSRIRSIFKECKEQREHIKERQVLNIEEWAKKYD